MSGRASPRMAKWTLRGVELREGRGELCGLLLDVGNDPRPLQDNAGVGGDELGLNAAEQQRGIVLRRKDYALGMGPPICARKSAIAALDVHEDRPAGSRADRPVNCLVAGAAAAAPRILRGIAGSTRSSGNISARSSWCLSGSARSLQVGR